MLSSIPPVVLVLVLCLVACKGHGADSRNQDLGKDNRFHDPQFVRDKEHIKEHLQEEIKINEKDMSNEELEFHYFKLHDLNNDTKLDGLEILYALYHMMSDQDYISPRLTDAERASKSWEEVAEIEENRKDTILKYYTDIIDRVLQDDDFNNDGYLTYIEYVHARRGEEARYKKYNSH